MGSLEPSCILTPGRPDRQNGVGQISKIFDFAQNDFWGVSDNFLGKKVLWAKIFFEGLRDFFSRKMHRKQIFE